MRVEWTAPGGAEIAEVAGLARRCVKHDGGLPETASEGYLARRYTGDGVTAFGAYADGLLVACGAVRPAGEGRAMTGLVDPGHRGRGLGSGLLDRLIEAAGPSPLLKTETESLTPEADELFRSRGFAPAFAEDVFRHDATLPLAPAPLPPGVRAEEWDDGNRDAFYAAYRASFAGRPGFPGWSRDQWIDWLVDDEFRPDCSLVAYAGDGTPAGFVACAEGFLVQVGAVPEWRGRGIGRALATAALERLRARGATEVHLDVNVNNPASAALFLSLGCTAIARRARYER